MRQVSGSRTGRQFSRYDASVEALLATGAAGVVESLLRNIARTTVLPKCYVYEAEVWVFRGFWGVLQF